MGGGGHVASQDYHRDDWTDRCKDYLSDCTIAYIELILLKVRALFLVYDLRILCSCVL